MILRFIALTMLLLPQVMALQAVEITSQGLIRRCLASLPKPYRGASLRWCSGHTKHPIYADATVDTAFKEMMWRGDNDPVATSFIRTFVPDIQVESIELLKSASVAIPALKERGRKQTFMDFHVKAKDGHHYLVEMQSQRHIRFDERALFYACSAYSRQLDEKLFNDSSWYRYLKPVIAIQVVDYDTNQAKGIKVKEIDVDGREEVH